MTRSCYLCDAEARCQQLDDENYLVSCEQSAGSAYVISNLAIIQLGKMSSAAKQAWSKVAHQSYGDAALAWVHLDDKGGVRCEVKKKDFFGIS